MSVYYILHTLKYTNPDDEIIEKLYDELSFYTIKHILKFNVDLYMSKKFARFLTRKAIVERKRKRNVDYVYLIDNRHKLFPPDIVREIATFF